MSMSRAISSNHASHDDQVEDAMDYLRHEHPDAYGSIVQKFPEYPERQLDGGWYDTETMGVDPEWSSWLTDAIEQTGLVIWEEGEPWVHEPIDTTQELRVIVAQAVERDDQMILESLDELVLGTATQTASNVVNNGEWLDYLFSNGWTEDEIRDRLHRA